MNLEEKIELRISKLVTLSIAIFFVFSLSLHNHPFTLATLLLIRFLNRNQHTQITLAIFVRHAALMGILNRVL